MCGIAGIVSSDREALQPLAAMLATLKHRGPDDEGYLLADTRRRCAVAYAGPDTDRSLRLEPLPAAIPDGVNLGLGNRRLSIIDLSSGGHGPMSSADGRLWITYNGEVFNYRELRVELEGLGHRFRSASDTEVLLSAYAQWGADCLHRLNGMWAFALYDSTKGLLFCARDRFGVKPFHYYAEAPLFAFASEIKGLLAHPAIPRRPHEAAIHRFLREGAADEGPDTFFAGIRRLRPGHFLLLDLATGHLRDSAWYTLPDPPARRADAQELRELLRDAVRLHLRSDVDVGTCLSGGLDSSTIVALTASLRDGAPGRQRSFSVVYPDPEIDESAHLDAVVARTGVEAARTMPTSAELLADLPKLVRHQDEPFPSASLYSQWRVMALARQAGVKVLLDGQGADEVFAGYHYHYGPYLAEIARDHGPGAALAAARRIARSGGPKLSLLLGLLAFQTLPAPAALRRAAVDRRATQGRIPARLLEPSFVSRAGNGATERHRPRPSLAAERRANIARTSLPALLRYEDRNSMAFSIEARVPFLDHRVVEWALAVPGSELIQEAMTKAVLRKAVAGLVPDTVRSRTDKIGFGTPERRWLRELAPHVREWLGPGCASAAFLRSEALRAYLAVDDARLAGRPGLWRLVSLELWMRTLRVA
jgi:asparagine synthase (glutamine-hydrolysing)